jgi:hypothetical protein
MRDFERVCAIVFRWCVRTQHRVNRSESRLTGDARGGGVAFLRDLDLSAHAFLRRPYRPCGGVWSGADVPNMDEVVLTLRCLRRG